MKMAITWTIVVLGALLHGMKCNSPPPTSQSSISLPVLTSAISQSSKSSPALTPSTSVSSAESPVVPPSTSPNPTESQVLTPSTTLSSPGSPDPPPSTSLSSAGSPDSIKPTSQSSSGLLVLPTSTSQSLIGSLNPTKTASVDSNPPATMGSTQPTLLDPTTTTLLNPTIPSLKSTTKDSPPQSNANNLLTEHSTTTIQPNTGLTVSNHSPQNSPTTVIPSVNSDTTNSSILATTTHNENDKTLTNQRDPSAVTTNPAPYSKSTGSQSIQTTEAKTTSPTKTSVPHPGSRRLDSDPETSSSTPRLPYLQVFDLSSSSERSIVFETCKTLGQELKGNCSVSLEFKGNQLVATVTINANQNISTENYKPQKQKADVSEETIPDTLVAILASCGALVLILCCFAAYCTYHRRSYRKNQQHLTEEMQTVENGYHDNPTLEVMEVVPEMQEKKLALNGEFNDSWIVPIDNLLKDDIPDEEDTHL